MTKSLIFILALPLSKSMSLHCTFLTRIFVSCQVAPFLEYLEIFSEHQNTNFHDSFFDFHFFLRWHTYPRFSYLQNSTDYFLALSHWFTELERALFWKLCGNHFRTQEACVCLLERIFSSSCISFFLGRFTVLTHRCHRSSSSLQENQCGRLRFEVGLFGFHD